jgi:hypothetical protein
MSKFDTKEDLLVSVQLLFNNMKIGKLSEEDMETLVSSTRELYERALILRYKAYENKIYGENTVQENDIIVPKPITEHLIVEPEIPIIEPIIETVEIKETEAPAFDMSFSLFDQLEEPNDTKVEENAPVSESAFQEPIVEEDNFSANETFESVEIEEKPVPIEKPIDPIPTTPKDLFDKMLDLDNSLGSKLMATKLDSLQGAFGLNEKLQIIRELFNGSSEAFTQAIQIFDMQPDFTHAKTILSNYTLEFSWELDTPIVVEFVQKIARRYA